MTAAPLSLAGLLQRYAPHILLVASVLILGAALASQHWGGLAPCALCLWQRWPYWIVIGLTLVGVMLPPHAPRKLNHGIPNQGRPGRMRARALVLFLVGVTFLAGAGIAAFHVGVEQGWWQGLASCGATGTALQTGLGADALRQQLLAAPVVRCDQPVWSLFGLSMAAYNGIASLVLAAAAFVWAAGTFRKQAPS